MKLDSYVSSCNGCLTSVFVRAGDPLPVIAGSEMSRFRLHRRAFEVFPGQDRFLMDTAKVLADIERQGWAIEALRLRFRVEDGRGNRID